jgi:RNA polymerase sigma-70 factor (ECF subfamily)
VVKETRRKLLHKPAALAEAYEPVAQADQADPPGPEVAQAVAALPEAYRQVILLRYYAGRSCAEISRELDVPVGTVTKRLSRAYALLRKALREDGPQDLEVRR